MNGRTSYVYDALNRLIKVTVYNDGTAGTESVTEYRYNYNGALTHQKDANGRVTTHSVNVWDLLETTTEPGLPGTEANRQFTRVYDADGRVVQRRERDTFVAAHDVDSFTQKASDRLSRSRSIRNCAFSARSSAFSARSSTVTP